MSDPFQPPRSEAREQQITLEAAKAILDAMPAIAVLLNSDGRITHYNPVFEALSGWPLNEGRGKIWFDHFLPARIREEVRRLFLAAVEIAPTRANQSAILLRDGTERLIEWNDNPLRIGSKDEPLLLAVGTDITERVAVEDVRQAENFKLQALIDNLHLAVGVYDRDGILLDCNDRPLVGADLSRADVLGKPFWDTAWWTHSSEEQKKLRQSMARAAQGERVQYHSRPMMAGNEIVDLDMVLAPLRNKSGAIEGIVGAGIEIGDRLRAERALEAKTLRLEEAQRVARLGSWELDLVSGELHWSPQTYEIFRRNPEAGPLSYAGFLDAIHPDDRDRVDRAYLNSLETRQAYLITHRLKFADGSEKWVEERCETSFSDNGEPRLSVGTVQDVTERVLSERALATSEASLSAILTASPESILVTDIDANIVMFSDGAEAQFGYRRDDMLGQPLRLLVDPADADQLADDLWPSVLSGQSGAPNMATQIISARRSDGTVFPAEVSLASVGEGAGQRVSIIARDVSERLAHEQALMSALERAEAAALAKRAFLATMSHEIRTPLNAVLGMMSLLEHTPLADQQREMVEVSSQAGKQLLSLLNDILDYSRLTDGVLKLETAAFDMGALLENVRDLNAYRAEENGVELTVSNTVPDDCVLEGDAGKLFQIVNNLVGNAVKFSPGGRVVASAFYSDAGPDAGLSICVADSGIGMSASDLDRIFERFTQLDMSNTRRFGGVGLGLSIVKGLVARMGGDIQVDSSPGIGSEFLVRIPLSPARAVTLPESGNSVPPTALPVGLRVLVAEDNALNALTLKLMLESLGCAVVIAGDGAAALEVFAAESFDVVVLDIQMPELDGLSALELMRRDATTRNLSPYFLACTANAGSEQVESYARAGFDAVIVKPVSIDALAGHLKSLDWRGDLA